VIPASILVLVGGCKGVTLKQNAIIERRISANKTIIDRIAWHFTQPYAVSQHSLSSVHRTANSAQQQPTRPYTFPENSTQDHRTPSTVDTQVLRGHKSIGRFMTSRNTTKHDPSVPWYERLRNRLKTTEYPILQRRKEHDTTSVAQYSA